VADVVADVVSPGDSVMPHPLAGAPGQAVRISAAAGVDWWTAAAGGKPVSVRCRRV